MGLITPEGYLKIVDRLKDMILVSGFNVYPNEVEEVVALHPGVLEACAIGVKDDGAGEAVKLYVVRKNTSLTAEQVIEHCRKNLTGYKIPKRVEFRDTLPKSPVGKILRRELRDEGRPEPAQQPASDEWHANVHPLLSPPHFAPLPYPIPSMMNSFCIHRLLSAAVALVAAPRHGPAADSHR